MTEKFLKEKKELIDCKIKELLTDDAELYAASSGKRLRPIITLAIAPKLPLNVAVAIEFIHIYSCIHDDLPSMDNDDIRHNKPTLHKVYPEWRAILTGDSLLTKAFELIANESKLSALKKLKMISLLASKSGGNGLIYGQILDLSSKKKITPLELKKIHLHKTADLFIAASGIGAIYANLKLEPLLHFGENFGLAFQIVDDILNFTSSSKTLGKPTKSDERATAISIYGLKKAKEMAKKYSSLAINATNINLLKNIAKICLNRIV